MKPLVLDRDSDAKASAPATTGRYLVLIEDLESGPDQLLKNRAGLTVMHSLDARAYSERLLAETGAYYFDNLGVALVEPDESQLKALTHAVSDSKALARLEPERIVYAIGADDYLRGYRDGVSSLADHVLGASQPAPAAGPALEDDALATWGLRAIGALASTRTGVGTRIAVLDTGFDSSHPDFAGRNVVTRSFVDGETAQDAHGHGTHCIGTACGPRSPSVGPRYGVAVDAEIFAGKVLNNRGSGADGWILAGIDWAVTQECNVVSMSLGAPTQLGDRHSLAFERAAQRAAARGTLIVAAAGNESGRPGSVKPVGHPANCPSIMAVAAVDSSLRVAWFSCGGLEPGGGQVDVAGPGVDVYSSWPMPQRYRGLNGTSMATPHVAGVAALFAEGEPKGTPAAQLWARIVQRARRLPLPSTDVGAGLVQAP